MNIWFTVGKICITQEPASQFSPWGKFVFAAGFLLIYWIYCLFFWTDGFWAWASGDQLCEASWVCSLSSKFPKLTAKTGQHSSLLHNTSISAPKCIVKGMCHMCCHLSNLCALTSYPHGWIIKCSYWKRAQGPKGSAGPPSQSICLMEWIIYHVVK